MPPILVLTGPTATGKSDWALQLAEDLPLEIVSVDSALVYCGMDIGTAKPSPQERARVPHHLIDIRDPSESYSAGEFVADAHAAIAAIHRRGRIALLVGGTMLYLRALLHGIAALPQASPQLRRELDARAAQEGWPALHAELRRLDPLSASRIHPHDPQRIQRALEVCLTTGRTLSELQRETRSALPLERIQRWALVPTDRRLLHARIERRFHSMLQQGFLDEVARLYARGDLTAQHPALRAVGYRQFWSHLAGEISHDEAIERGIAASRQLAKRQLTWIRADAEIACFDPFAADSFAKWRQFVLQSVAELGR